LLAIGSDSVEHPQVSSSGYGYTAAPRAVDVLPGRVSRRVTRRDGLLPLLLAVELAVGVAFGVAGASGSTYPPPAASTATRVVLGSAPLVTVLPSTRPVAMAQVLPAGPALGPAVGALVPGTVRPPVAEVPVVTVVPPAASPPPYRRHPARDPFLTLVRG
jgi:hypothetical protein